MDITVSDTIDIDISALEYLQSFERECTDALNSFENIRKLLYFEDVERSEVIEHKMATVTLYKDLFRVQLDKLLQSLLSSEIGKLPDGTDKDLLSNVTLDNITSFLENDILLDETSISNELKNIILNIIKKINHIVANWEFLAENPDSFEEYGIDSIRSEIEYLLTDNIATFLGENIKLAESFLEDVKDNFTEDELEQLQLLIKENGLRKVEFGYELDFEKIKYLIYSAIRCRTQLANEREDVELFNLVTVLLLNFRNNPGTNKIIEDVKALYSNKPEVLENLDSLIQLERRPRLLIENSPPIYKNVQHNLMYRIYEATDGGVKVHIFSIPYNQLDAQKEIDGTPIQTFPVEGNALENNILSKLIASDRTLEDILAEHPTIEKIGVDTIRDNDSVLDPILDNLVNGLIPFVRKVVQRLPTIISDPLTRAQFVKTYEDTIRAIDLSLKDKSKIETTLDEDELSQIQEQVLERVMGGQSIEAAIQDIVGNKEFDLKSESDGDCVQFETEVKGKESSEDLSMYKDGTVLNTKEVEANGFKSEITEVVMDGKRINLVKCIVCQKQFDTCEEACPECKTERAMQYNAIYKGSTKEGKAAIEEVNRRIAERKEYLKQDLEEPIAKDVSAPVNNAVGGAIAGAFTGFLNILSFGMLDNSESTFIES